MENAREIVFRPFMDTPEPVHASAMLKRLRHPFFAWARLRPIIAQHTSAEHEALKRWARGRSCVVEIGVAEGASALASREVMSSDGTLYLIDPFHLSRVRWLNCQRRAAEVAVSDCQTASVVWIEQFSFDAVKSWNKPIDFLFIDGDHSEEGVMRDWIEWSPFVNSGGCVAFHDARMFEGGWPKETDGPVRAVNQLFQNRPSSEWRIAEEVHSLVIVGRT
jgi:predicted O-methyltransferase YrrM